MGSSRSITMPSLRAGKTPWGNRTSTTEPWIAVRCPETCVSCDASAIARFRLLAQNPKLLTLGVVDVSQVFGFGGSMASRDVLTVGNRLFMKREPLTPGRLFLIAK